VTPILGEMREGAKTTLRDPRVLPEVDIYDVDLTLALPVGTSAASGLNAIAHAVEALYARDRNPLISLAAEEGIEALARALPRISEDPRDREARSDALYGAWLYGVCLGTVGMALHHKLCRALAASSVCHTPRRTRSSYRTPRPTMPSPPRRPWRASREPWGPTMPREASTASQASLG
jgi:alcohol dehydrogenase class IV